LIPDETQPDNFEPGDVSASADVFQKSHFPDLEKIKLMLFKVYLRITRKLKCFLPQASLIK
jgi:hypothetical protein